MYLITVVRLGLIRYNIFSDITIKSANVIMLALKHDVVESANKKIKAGTVNISCVYKPKIETNVSKGWAKTFTVFYSSCNTKRSSRETLKEVVIRFNRICFYNRDRDKLKKNCT